METKVKEISQKNKTRDTRIESRREIEGRRSIQEIQWSNNWSRKRKWRRGNYLQNNLI